MSNRPAPKDFGATFPTKPLSACLESVKVPAKIPRSSFLTDGKLPIISQESDFINGYWNNEADAIHVDGPVVVFGDHTRVLKLIDFDFVVGADGVKILKPKAFLDAAFLRYFLEANPIPSSGYARHYRHISGIGIPLPPPEEQKRIVVALDQAFAALDRARVNTEANSEDANELFEISRGGLLTDCASRWKEAYLGATCVVERGSSPRPIKQFLTNDPSGVNWVKIGDTKLGSKFVTETQERITLDGSKKSRAVYKGDFILTNSMTYGRPYIMAIDGFVHDGWFVLRLRETLNKTGAVRYN